MSAAPARRERTPRQTPWWVRGARAIIGRMPAGRFRAAAQVARLARAPFIARLPPELGGARFWCDLGDEIARDACLAGGYEPQVSQVFTQLLTPGMTVVDTGANWGYFSLVAAALVGDSGTVLALEPDPRMFDLLQRNLRLNAFSRVHALPVAGGAARGVLLLEGYREGAGNRGTSHIRTGGEGAGAGLVRVPSAPLDALAAEHGLTTVDVIKIDVEGAEDAVLAGMREGLRAHRFTRVLIELHPALLAERGVTPDACCAPLLEAGYRGWTFDHTPAALRRAAYTGPQAIERLLRPSDRVPAGDPWPHMLWTIPGADPL